MHWGAQCHIIDAIFKGWNSEVTGLLYELYWGAPWFKWTTVCGGGGHSQRNWKKYVMITWTTPHFLRTGIFVKSYLDCDVFASWQGAIHVNSNPIENLLFMGRSQSLVFSSHLVYQCEVISWISSFASDLHVCIFVDMFCKLYSVAVSFEVLTIWLSFLSAYMLVNKSWERDT